MTMIIIILKFSRPVFCRLTYPPRTTRMTRLDYTSYNYIILYNVFYF